MAKEIIEYHIVAMEELPDSESEALREMAAADMQVIDNPALDDPTRSLAFVKFILCRSLPAVNRNRASWTYATLKNSLKTVAHQVIDLNHHLEQNSALLGKKVSNQVVGHMISAEIADSPDDNLVPSEAIPLIVKAVVNKRIAPNITQRLKNGEKLKISMECEYEDFGFWWDGKLWEQQESEVLWSAFKANKKDLNGKPIARVLGGVSPEGGIVNFWGAAILIDEAPADPEAKILAAIAIETEKETMDDNAPIMTVPEATDINIGLTPALMITDKIEDINHEELSKSDIINDLVKSSVEKAIQEKITELMSLASLDNEALQFRDPKNADIDPNADYADPGFTGDKTPKFPLNSKEEVLQAISFFQKDSRDNYTPDQNDSINKRILRAASKFGLGDNDLNDFVNRASQPEAASGAITREEQPMNTPNEKNAAEVAAEASTELAATKKAIIDKLSGENATLKNQLDEMAKQIDNMTKNEQLRAKKDRAVGRKKDMAKKLGELDESLESALASFVDEADDDEFVSFKAIAELIYDRGFVAGTQKVPSQDQIMGSQGESTPATRKITVTDPNPPAAILLPASGNPDTLKETASVTPYAPFAPGAEVASTKKTNRFASL